MIIDTLYAVREWGGDVNWVFSTLEKAVDYLYDCAKEEMKYNGDYLDLSEKEIKTILKTTREYEDWSIYKVGCE